MKAQEIIGLRGAAEQLAEFYRRVDAPAPALEDRLNIIFYEHDWSLLALNLYLADGSTFAIALEDLPDPKGRSEEQRLEDAIVYLKRIGFQNINTADAIYLNQ